MSELVEVARRPRESLVKAKLSLGVRSVALQEDEEDKYAFEKGATIDCENHVHLCRAACCRLDFALSKQDIEEGIVKWELGRLYLIAKHAEMIQ